jgi:hypothetical protein
MDLGTAQASYISDLTCLIYWNEDARRTTYDLAFILTTHGYDATLPSAIISW